MFISIFKSILWIMELLQMIFGWDFCDRPTDNGYKLKDCRYTLDIRNNSFMNQVVKHWSWLHREVIDALSLERFKVRLEGH